MNYKELERAVNLLNEIKNIDRMIENIVDYNYVEIETEHAANCFEEKHTQKFINVLKEIKEEIINN